MSRGADRISCTAVSRCLWATTCAALLSVALAGATLRAQPDVARGRVAEPRFDTVILRGRVEWLAQVLERRYGIRQLPEAAERVLVLETSAGELHPLIEDVRGRAFRRDERLRHLDVEFVSRRHHGSPFVQVIQAYELRQDGKYEIDYWCEICSIVMYELKECDCCQGPIELRKTKVNAGKP